VFFPLPGNSRNVAPGEQWQRKSNSGSHLYN